MTLKSFTPSNVARRIRILLDRLRGLDFVTAIQPEDVGLDSNYAYTSSSSGNKYLANLLGDFNITPEDSIIDIGCGKGSAMRTMLKFPFARVDGIELSGQIAAIAVRNFRKLNANRTRIFVCDAPLFNNYDAYNMVYLFNPFPPSVMSRVVDALIQSVRRAERELVMIYNNAVCHDVVVARGVFARKGVYPDEWGNGISIYSNRSGTNSRLSANRRMRRPADSGERRLIP